MRPTQAPLLRARRTGRIIPMSAPATEIARNYQAVQQRVASAAAAVGRDPGSVRLVVVTKGQPLTVVRAVTAAGASILGENYADEAMRKIEALSGGAPVEWHMVGHVQSRRADIVARHFDLVHSLDSVRLATRLDRAADAAARVQPVLLEFNVAGESTKSGWLAVDETRWHELLADVSAILALPHLRVCGLMAMPPLGNRPDDSRPYFRRLMRVRDYLSSEFQPATFFEVSLGTSFDFEVAVEEGATMVRVGTAIVGPRPAQNGG